MNAYRRRFLHDGSLLLAGLAASFPSELFAEEDVKTASPLLRIGLVTDLHYADKPRAGTRFYRDTLTKLAATRESFEKSPPAMIVELGDFIDAADSLETEKQYLQKIQKEFKSIPGEKHYVLGNHCVTTLRKAEFLDEVEQPRAHYSFDRGGYHFIILDSCFRHDGKPYERANFKWNDANIPAEQVEWLRDDLKQTSLPTIVFAHQRLDVTNDYGVKNAAEIRKLFVTSGKVLAVFQGHSHKNDLQEIDGIIYCTLVAMVEGEGLENNGFALLDLYSRGIMRLQGFRQQKSYQWG